MNVVNSLVFIIIPVHNRKATTLTCLETLKQQGDLSRYSVVVVDDGSTDGTGDAIASQFPTVHVLTGDGNLWWTGAICKGMEYAVNQGAEYLIWLNDDCLPKPDSIQKLVAYCQANSTVVAGGQSLDPETQQASYGGIVSQGIRIAHVHTVQGSLQECDGLSGNFVCIPRAVVESIGYPEAQICPHYYGDVVYTHQAKRRGYRLVIVGDAIAHCKDDHLPISWLTTDRSIDQLWQERFMIKSPHYWKAHLTFYREISGAAGIGVYIYEMLIKFFVISMIATILPYRYRSRLKQFIKGAA